MGPLRNHLAMCFAFLGLKEFGALLGQMELGMGGQGVGVCCGSGWLSRSLLTVPPTFWLGFSQFAQRVAC